MEFKEVYEETYGFNLSFSFRFQLPNWIEVSFSIYLDVKFIEFYIFIFTPYSIWIHFIINQRDFNLKHVE